MSQNQLLSVFGQHSPTTTGTSGQVLVSGGSAANTYWASTLPVTAYSVQFNGSSQWLTLASNTALSFGTSNFTIEFWMNSTSSTNSRIMGNSSGPSFVANKWVIAFNTTAGTVGVYCYNYSSSATMLISAATNLNNGAWHHIAIVRNGTVFTLYVDGVSSSTVTTSVSYDGGGSNPLTIGYTNISGDTAYNGYLSNARVVNGVAVYTGAFTPPTSPLGTSQGSGTNIAAVTASQTSLLTCNGPGFTDSSTNAFTITNVGNSITSQYTPFSSFVALTKSAVQTQTILTTGTGTYYTPSGVAWLQVRMVGGGGGGGGSGTSGSGGQGGTGANTIFGSIQAYGGAGGNNTWNVSTGGLGGSGTLGGLTGIVINGGQGGTAGVAGIAYAGGGQGGSSAFGGAGGGAVSTANGGAAAATNSGSGGGGGGGGSTNVAAGMGGGSGGYVEAFIPNPLASYAYTVGANGAAGTAGASGLAGGAGGSGLIIVEENYTVSTAAGSYSVNYLIVAGGGGGAGGLGQSSGNGGGGAGGLLTGTAILVSGSIYTVVVGAAGSAGVNTAYNSPGGQGGSSSVTGLTTAVGGGGGQAASGNLNGGTGGSGGGASGNSNTNTGGAGTSGQGNAGGSGGSGAPNYGAGGGGGASAAGGAGTTTVGGSGGAGTSSSITGSSVTYAGGGGGGTYNGGTVGTGGSGGGGNAGASNGGIGSSGTINTGGGGGGASFNPTAGLNYAGGAGGSGVVILAIPVSLYSGITTGIPTVTASGQYKILTFTSSGTYTA